MYNFKSPAEEGFQKIKTIQCDAIRSEHLENGHFSYAYILRITHFDKYWRTFATQEYGRVKVFKIEMRSLV